MNRKHLLVSTAMAAVLTFSSQAEAALLGGSAAGGFGESLSRGPVNGSMSGDLNSRFRTRPDVGAVENRTSATAQDAKGAAGGVTSDAKSAGRGAAGSAKGAATQSTTTAASVATSAATSAPSATDAASHAATAGVSADHGVNAAGSAGNALGVNSDGNSTNPALPNANANSAQGGGFDGSAGTKSPASASVGASSVTDTTAMNSQQQKPTASEARQSHQ